MFYKVGRKIGRPRETFKSGPEIDISSYAQKEIISSVGLRLESDLRDYLTKDIHR